VLEDRALQAIASHLEAKLTWLDRAFGRASKLAITREGRQVFYPAYPSGDETSGKEYIALWPDENIGNFCWFDLRDEQVVESWGRRNMNKNLYSFRAGMVFSFNLKTIYGAYWKNYTTANVVNEIFSDALVSFSNVGVSIIADRWFVNAENVYRGYSHNEVKNQFNMRPYGICRIDLGIKYSPDCLLFGGTGIDFDSIEGSLKVYP
jgi:hypothetical protein